jgi:predicted N-acetyltransferase YhbS
MTKPFGQPELSWLPCPKAPVSHLVAEEDNRLVGHILFSPPDEAFIIWVPKDSLVNDICGKARYRDEFNETI